MFSSTIHILGATLLSPDASTFELDHLDAFQREAMLTLKTKGVDGPVIRNGTCFSPLMPNIQCLSRRESHNQTILWLGKAITEIHPEICILWSRTGSFDKKAHAF